MRKFCFVTSDFSDAGVSEGSVLKSVSSMIDIQVMRHSLAPLLARLENIHYSDIKKIQAEVVQSLLRFLSIIHW